MLALGLILKRSSSGAFGFCYCLVTMGILGRNHTGNYRPSIEPGPLHNEVLNMMRAALYWVDLK